MSTRKIVYSVGISNKFSAFEDASDSEQVAPVQKDDKTKTQSSNFAFSNRPPKPTSKKAHDNKNVDNPKEFGNYEARTTVLTDEQLRDTRAQPPKKGHFNRDVKQKSGSNRIFDRKSGTGRGKEMKKHGEGGHNWGGVTNDAKSMAESRYVSIDGTQETSVANDGEGVEMIDYLSYKKQQLAKRSKLPNSPSLQTGVPTDQEFRNSGYVKYVKEVPEEYNLYKGKSPRASSVSKHNVDPKVKSDIGVRNYSLSFGERRGTTKLNKNKLSDQHDRTKTKVAPDVADHSLFPSLS